MTFVVLFLALAGFYVAVFLLINLMMVMSLIGITALAPVWAVLAPMILRPWR